MKTLSNQSTKLIENQCENVIDFADDPYMNSLANRLAKLVENKSEDFGTYAKIERHSDGSISADGVLINNCYAYMLNDWLKRLGGGLFLDGNEVYGSDLFEVHLTEIFEDDCYVREELFLL